jgi:4-amino-4-deoxy-L-arabinose transferase-like glycosyltransferase
MALIATGSVLLTYGIARHTCNRPVAYIAAILCACNGVLIFYDTSLLIAPLVTFLSLLSLYFMGKLSMQYSVKTAILLGISLGLTALARSNIFLIMPFLFLWMIGYFPGKFLHKTGYYVLICLVMLLTILPVTVRNFYSNETHPFVLTNSNGGRMLWIGNNPSADGTAKFSEELLREMRKRLKETGSSYVHEVFRYIREQPVDYLKLEYKKFRLFWQGYELGNLIPYYIFRYISKILGLPWFNFVLIGPLGIVGMALVLRKWNVWFILYSYVFIQLLSTLLFHALARYRVPVVPILSIFAAYTIWYSIQAFQKRQWHTFGITIGVFLILYFMINYPYAAYLYQQHHGEPMPFLRSFRYWDLFYTW